MTQPISPAETCFSSRCAFPPYRQTWQTGCPPLAGPCFTSECCTLKPAPTALKEVGAKTYSHVADEQQAQLHRVSKC